MQGTIVGRKSIAGGAAGRRPIGLGLNRRDSLLRTGSVGAAANVALA